MKIFLLNLVFTSFAFAQISNQLPAQPTDASHPGSSSYKYNVKHENFQINGRRVDLYMPAEVTTEKFSVVVFGHGQAIDVEGYEETFNHLARKGIAVIHPMFDTGFFDRDWRRMADDFNSLTKSTLQKYATVLNDKKVVYAGHSKGGYIALMAAGAPSKLASIGSVLVFAPAGFDEEYLRKLDTKLPVTLVWSDEDRVIKQGAITEIYSKLPSQNKQWILVKSYPTLKAGHFFPLTKSYIFGGQNGSNALHYYGMWKWLVAAASDLDGPTQLSNIYLYGNQTSSTGVNGLNDVVTRNF